MLNRTTPIIAVIVAAAMLPSCFLADTDEYRPGRQARDANNQAIKSLAEKDYEHALMQIDKAIAAEPEFYAAYANKAAILTAMSRDADAANALRSAIEVKPDYVDVYVPLGLLLERTGKPEEAKPFYQKAVALYDARVAANPNNVDVAVNRAVAVYLGQDARVALVSLKEILEKHPDHEKAKQFKQAIEKGDRQTFIAGMGK